MVKRGFQRFVQSSKRQRSDTGGKEEKGDRKGVSQSMKRKEKIEREEAGNSKYINIVGGEARQKFLAFDRHRRGSTGFHE